MINILFLLIVGHAVADYGLQTEYIAMNKSPRSNGWQFTLLAHSLIHAGTVYLITGLMPLAMMECVLHFMIDMFRSTESISRVVDQTLHFLCKAFYVIILVMVM